MPELTTEHYLEALDVLEENKEKIALWDLIARNNPLKIAASYRRVEAQLDATRLRAFRERIKHDLETVDAKHSMKYWQAKAAQLGIEWRAD